MEHKPIIDPEEAKQVLADIYGKWANWKLKKGYVICAPHQELGLKFAQVIAGFEYTLHAFGEEEVKQLLEIVRDPDKILYYESRYDPINGRYDQSHYSIFEITGGLVHALRDVHTQGPERGVSIAEETREKAAEMLTKIPHNGPSFGRIINALKDKNSQSRTRIVTIIITEILGSYVEKICSLNEHERKRRAEPTGSYKTSLEQLFTGNPRDHSWDAYTEAAKKIEIPQELRDNLAEQMRALIDKYQTDDPKYLDYLLGGPLRILRDSPTTISELLFEIGMYPFERMEVMRYFILTNLVTYDDLEQFGRKYPNSAAIFERYTRYLDLIARIIRSNPELRDEVAQRVTNEERYATIRERLFGKDNPLNPAQDISELKARKGKVPEEPKPRAIGPRQTTK